MWNRPPSALRGEAAAGEASSAPMPSRRLLRHAGAVVTVLLLGFSTSLTLEYMHADVIADDPVEHVLALDPGLLLLGGLVATALLSLTAVLTGRLRVAVAGAVVVVALLGPVNQLKKEYREEPLFPGDVTYLREMAFLIDNVGTGAALGILGTVVAAPGVVWAIGRVVRRRFGVPHPRTVRTRLLRLVLVLTAGAVLLSAAAFNRDGNPLRRAFDGVVDFWVPYSQWENYYVNGFVAGLLYNLPARPMAAPVGYSEQAVQELVLHYQQRAESVNATRSPAALDGVNVVIVLGETFTDPMLLDGVRVAEDPIPFTRDLMRSTTSGLMVSPAFGGGTANVEFEVLTGMAVGNFSAQTHTPYQSLVAGAADFPSHLVYLGSGRSTQAIHPWYADFYQRERVYPSLGIEHATFLPEMSNVVGVEGNGYVADSATYREALDTLRSAEEPVLLQVVTMQNHHPYSGKYSQPIGVSAPFADATSRQEISHYLAGLRHSDNTVRDLLTELNGLGEPTIVLFYGDHLPGAWSSEVLDRSPELTRYLTPWFVWATFPTATIQPDTPIGPNHLVNQLLAAAGAPITPWNALLAALEEELPALESANVLDSAGRPTDLESLSPGAERVLEHYRLIQYDMTAGRGYGTEAMLTVPPHHSPISTSTLWR